MNFTTKKFDRRRKYYLVLDCETATLPMSKEYDKKSSQQIALAKPLIYDLGWQIIDRKGNIYERKNFLIAEIFSVPTIFNTAYYKNKRPLYVEKLRNNEIVLTDWKTATNELVNALEKCTAVGAYNSMFDFKKAIPFTEQYINNLYSTHYYEWEKRQKKSCDNIAAGNKPTSSNFSKDYFIFRDVKYPLFDIWAMACEYLLNNDEYKSMCIANNWVTNSGKYFKTSAETAYRFFTKEMNFDEAHTAVDDAIIESELFAKIVEKNMNHLILGLVYFPFRILGTVEEFDY